MIGLRGTLEDAGLAAALRQLQQQLAKRLEQATETVARTLEQKLADEAPISPGYPGAPVPGGLRRSIRFDLSGSVASFVASQVAEFVIGGTEPHEIFARNAPVLHFYWAKAGGFVSFARVSHPGTKPFDFRAAAVDSATASAEQELAAVFDWIGTVLA